MTDNNPMDNDFDQLAGEGDDDEIYVNDLDGHDTAAGGTGQDPCQSDGGDIEQSCEI